MIITEVMHCMHALQLVLQHGIKVHTTRSVNSDCHTACGSVRNDCACHGNPVTAYHTASEESTMSMYAATGLHMNSAMTALSCQTCLHCHT